MNQAFKGSLVLYALMIAGCATAPNEGQTSDKDTITPVGTETSYTVYFQPPTWPAAALPDAFACYVYFSYPADAGPVTFGPTSSTAVQAYIFNATTRPGAAASFHCFDSDNNSALYDGSSQTYINLRLDGDGTRNNPWRVGNAIRRLDINDVDLSRINVGASAGSQRTVPGSCTISSSTIQPVVTVTIQTNHGIYLIADSYTVVTSFTTIDGPSSYMQTANLQ